MKFRAVQRAYSFRQTRCTGHEPFSYLGGSLFPVVPYLLLPLHIALILSVGLTLAALFGLGVYKSRLAHGKMLRGGLEVVCIGAFSGGAGCVLGSLMPTLLRMAGIKVT
jgi:predicted membrane protein (TIGR00267 family)